MEFGIFGGGGERQIFLKGAFKRGVEFGKGFESIQSPNIQI